jgi:hypothetical protein
MNENFLNNKYVKILGATGAISSIVFSVSKKSGIKKGIGNYFLFTISGTILGISVYLIMKK